MRLGRFFKLNSVFTRFMLSYIVLLCFTVLIGVVTYSETLKMVKENAIQEGLAVLEKQRDIIDTNFVEVENLITQVSLQEEVRNLYKLTKPLKPKDYWRLMEAFSRVRSLLVTNSFIDDLYLVFNNSDLLISSKYISDRLPTFYNNFIRYEGIEYNQWNETIMSSYHYKRVFPAHSVNTQNYIYPMITYAQSIPLSSYNTYKGVVLALINENKLQDYFSTLNISKGGKLYIVDEQDQVISSIDTGKKNVDLDSLDFSEPKGYLQKSIDGTVYIIMHTTSAQLGWKYIAALPTNIFEGKAAFVSRLFGITFAVILFVGIFIALYLSYRNSEPISKILKNLREVFENQEIQTKTDYDFIEGTVSKLIINNKELSQELDSKIPFIRAVFFERLLQGDFNLIREIKSALSYARLSIEGELYTVALMRINGFDKEPNGESVSEMEVARLVGEKVLKQNLWEQCYLHNVDENKIAILMVMDNEFARNYEDNIERRLGEIIDKLNNDYKIRVSFGIGQTCSNLMDVSNSYKESEKALEYKCNELVRKIVWFSNIPKEDKGYYYPIDLEMRLINLTRVGEENEVMSVIKHIYEKNFIKNRLSVQETDLLINEIRGTIEKIKTDVMADDQAGWAAIDALVSRMELCKSTDSMNALIVEIYHSLCGHINNKVVIQEEYMIQRIIDYINIHYMDENLCLYQVASEFELTEKYFSQFFKDKTNQNFSTYVEKLRMEHAVKLLDCKDMSVADIARKVGYGNNNTFYKAFKRTHGMSPSVYRRNYLK